MLSVLCLVLYLLPTIATDRDGVNVWNRTCSTVSSIADERYRAYAQGVACVSAENCRNQQYPTANSTNANRTPRNATACGRGGARMKKFMSSKASAAAPQAPAPAVVPAVVPAAAAGASSAGPPTDEMSKFLKFELLLMAANMPELPRPGASPAERARGGRTKSAGGGSARKIGCLPPTPPAILALGDAIRAAENLPPLEVARSSSHASASGSSVRHPLPALGGSVSAPSLVTPSSSSSSPSSSTGVIRMSGYLKKKRNRMGGWRKRYFILQNHLLLSYSSRDDYVKKLAPFKDIINLVPGTMIIPTAGPRFIIETNSKVLYTFRCDSHRSCSDWIMALLECLKAEHGGLNNDRIFSPQNIFQRSTLPLAGISLPERSGMSDRAIQQPWLDMVTASSSRSSPWGFSKVPPKPPRSFTTNVAHHSGGLPEQQQVPQEAPTTGSSAAVRTVDDDALNNNVALTKPTSSGSSRSGSSRSTRSASSSMRRKILAFESQANLPRAQSPVLGKGDATVEGGALPKQWQQSKRRRAASDRGPRASDDEGHQQQQHAEETIGPEHDRWMWWLRKLKPTVVQGAEDDSLAGMNVSALSSITDCSGPSVLPGAAAGDADEDAAEGGPNSGAEDGCDGLADGGLAAGGLSKANGEKRAEGAGKQSSPPQQQFFRLHPSAWRKPHQSVEVSRINSMFGERTAGPETAHLRGAKPVSEPATRVTRATQEAATPEAGGRAQQRGRQQQEAEEAEWVARAAALRERATRREPAGRRQIVCACSDPAEVEMMGLALDGGRGLNLPTVAVAEAQPVDQLPEYAEVFDYRAGPGPVEVPASQASSSSSSSRSEPIYAVVDICAKRTRRAARQEVEEHHHQQQQQQQVNEFVPRLPARNTFVSVSLPQIPSAADASAATLELQIARPVAKRSYSSNYNSNNDYEDVADFLDRSDPVEGEGFIGKGKFLSELDRATKLYSDDDHIYESVLFPDPRFVADAASGSSSSLPGSSSSSSGHQGGGLWKHLKRMQLDSSRLTLRRVFSGERATEGTGAVSKRGAPPVDTRLSSAFEGLGRRLEGHRRSIKKRLKSLYDRGGGAPAATGASPSTPSSSWTYDEQRRQQPGAPPPSLSSASSSSSGTSAFDLARASRQSRPSLSLESFLATRPADSKKKNAPPLPTGDAVPQPRPKME